MPERLPTALRKAVIEGYLYSMTRKEILRTVGRSYKKIGSGSVTNIEREFENEVDRIGLEAVARDFGVSQLVEDLKEVGGFSKTKSVSLEQVLALSSKCVTNLERWAAANEISQLQSCASSLGEVIHRAIVGP